MVYGFTKAGYPQHLRILLGIAKPAAAIVLLLPGFALLKEWAYAGAAFAWVMAVVAHYSAGDGVQIWGMPLVLLTLLIVSYVTSLQAADWESCRRLPEQFSGISGPSAQ